MTKTKKIGLAVFVLSVLCLLISVILPLGSLLTGGSSVSVGIIGGSGAPTFALLYKNYGMIWFTLAGLVGVITSIIIYKKK